MLLFMQFLYKYISYWNSKEQNVITWLSRMHRKIILNSTCESAAYTAKYATNSMMININFWGMIIRGLFCVLAKTIQYLNSFNVLMNIKTNWNLNAACCDWITGMSMPSLFMYCIVHLLSSFFSDCFVFNFFRAYYKQQMSLSNTRRHCPMRHDVLDCYECFCVGSCNDIPIKSVFFLPTEYCNKKPHLEHI